ncbi:hypothetical protein [Planomonospora venezuelensis]|uniref:Helix-turn-helix domain-containing protein n=1 Tax=Planomonospora venezuelensis TaxID=1999 RepID=A0A841CX22_PLAVE|nr:hypothetical protein [Planomonospora venezuelensis]MBB5960864.1 hypothetical protein [Planomonospora venezuelensis]GIN01098.1 hypothetical protein Pve01_27560 [Planomonospora venezuelensis]
MSHRSAGFRRAELPADNFTMLSNRWIRDKRLTWKSRGILAWLASHAVGFRVSEKAIIGAAPDGRDSVRAGIRELETTGYLRRERKRDASGKLSVVEYVLSDPWTTSATSAQVGTNDGFSVPGGDDRPAPTTENPAEAATSDNTPDAQITPTTENPSEVVTSENGASPQVGTNDGKSVPLRRTEDQKKTKKKTTDPLRAVGALTVRTARDAATTPSASQEEISWLAGEVLGQMPDHYRKAPAWLRTRLLARIAEALTEHAPLALAEYCHKFADDPNFGDYEHLRRFSDVVRKLAADVADGTCCAGCGRDPRHPFCDAGIAGGTR